MNYKRIADRLWLIAVAVVILHILFALAIMVAFRAIPDAPMLAIDHFSVALVSAIVLGLTRFMLRNHVPFAVSGTQASATDIGTRFRPIFTVFGRLIWWIAVGIAILCAIGIVANLRALDSAGGWGGILTATSTALNALLVAAGVRHYSSAPTVDETTT